MSGLLEEVPHQVTVPEQMSFSAVVCGELNTVRTFFEGWE